MSMAIIASMAAASSALAVLDVGPRTVDLDPEACATGAGDLSVSSPSSLSEVITLFRGFALTFVDEAALVTGFAVLLVVALVGFSSFTSFLG